MHIGLWGRFLKDGVHLQLRLTGEGEGGHNVIHRVSPEGFYRRGHRRRDRTTAASTAQINTIAADPKFELLSDSATTDAGAPLVSHDGMVISGNGRTLGLRAAGGEKSIADYRKKLRAFCKERGIRIQKGIKNPILIRRLPTMTTQQLEELATKSNKAAVLSYNAAETAENDGKMLREHRDIFLLFQPNAEGDIRSAANRPFVNAFLQLLPITERAGLVDSQQNLTDAGEKRILNAMLSAIVAGHPNARGITQTLIERAEALRMKQVLKAIVKIAPELFALDDSQNGPTYSLLSDIAFALERGIEFMNDQTVGAKPRWGSIEEFSNQGSIDFESGGVAFLPTLTTDILSLLFGKPRKTILAISSTFGKYVEYAKSHDTTGANLFGEPAQAREDLWKIAVANVGQKSEAELADLDLLRQSSDPNRLSVTVHDRAFGIYDSAEAERDFHRLSTTDSPGSLGDLFRESPRQALLGDNGFTLDDPLFAFAEKHKMDAERTEEFKAEVQKFDLLSRDAAFREAMTIFELPRASVTASAGNAAGEANEDDRSEIQRQEADVIARFTNPDGTKKESWMKYEDGTPITGLTERQFVQVQTPNFKRYFGDWQSLIIRNMLDQTPAPVIQEGAFKKIEGESVWDAASRLLKNHVTHKTRIGNVIIDSRSAQDSLNQGKNQAKLDALVSIQCDFANAVYITSTPHRKKKKTMEHYFAYPVMYNGEREIVFCTVEEDINKNRLYLHDVVIERDLIDESNTHTTGARGNSSRHDGGVAHSRSILLSLYRVNTNDVSKIVDRHGWPLKVYHGATEEFWSFDKTKQRMNRSGDAFWATTSMAVARTYAGSSGVIREGFVNVRNAKRINANNAPHFKVKAGAHTGTSRIVGRTNRKHFDGVIFDKVKDVNAFNMNLSPATSIAFFEPNQFKSATDNTGAFDPAEYDIRLSITAYHGTPHDFERFDHSFMGSGEGAQAYGWGTYLSAVEGVARGYAERLWGKAIRKANKSGIMVKLLRDKHVINEIIPFQERQLKDLYQRRESFAR